MDLVYACMCCMYAGDRGGNHAVGRAAGAAGSMRVHGVGAAARHPSHHGRAGAARAAQYRRRASEASGRFHGLAPAAAGVLVPGCWHARSGIHPHPIPRDTPVHTSPLHPPQGGSVLPQSSPVRIPHVHCHTILLTSRNGSVELGVGGWWLVVNQSALQPPCDWSLPAILANFQAGRKQQNRSIKPLFAEGTRSIWSRRGGSGTLLRRSSSRAGWHPCDGAGGHQPPRCRLQGTADPRGQARAATHAGRTGT